MSFLETPEEKKSFTITSVLFVILFLLFAFLGLTYMDPPPENGIAVNFGTSDVGQGEIQPIKPIASAPQTSQVQPETTQDEEVLTDESDSPVVIQPKKNTPKPKTPTEPKPEVKPTPKPSQQTNNTLSSILNGPKSEGDASGGHGNDGLPGDKGDPNGSIYANSFYGSGSGNGNGSGNGTGWGLAGRKLAGNTKKVQDCNESGTVVVKIWVNRSGNVIKAERTQGTTNTNPCLVNPALETARTFKWQADSNAPETQIGFVVVNFKLGE
jgi:outer membrane biosynthesis protein TonB